MGLDIYYYDKKKEEHFLAEISEGLHNQIFYGNMKRTIGKYQFMFNQVPFMITLKKVQNHHIK